MSAYFYSEELSKPKLRRLLREVHDAAFPSDSFPAEVKIEVARGFYLPTTAEVLKDLAPLIMCTPSSKKELLLTMVHELCHHKLGYVGRTERAVGRKPHGKDFQCLYRQALKNLRRSFTL